MLNKIIMQGRLTKDPVEKQSENGKSVFLFSLANNRGKGREPLYIDCKAFGKTGETILKYLEKGIECIVTGELAVYHGEKRDYWSISVQSFEFCGAVKSAAGESAKPDEKPKPEPAKDEENKPLEYDDVPF